MPEFDPRIKGLSLKGAGGKSDKKRSFLSKLVGGVASAIKGVPYGLYKTGEEIGAAVEAIPTAAVEFGLGMSPEDIERNRILRHVTTTRFNRYEGETPLQSLKRALPVSTAIVEGGKQTISHLNPAGGFRSLRKDYAEDPVGAFLNDAANIAIAASAGAAAAGKAASVAEAAGRVGAAERAASLASKLRTAEKVAGKAAAAPFLPYKVPGKLLTKAGEAGFERYQEAVAQGEQPSKLATVAAKVSPQARALRKEILRGQAEEAAATEKTAKLYTEAIKKLPDPVEQEALTAHLEGLGKTFSVLRKGLSEKQFTEYIKKRFEDTLSPKAARIAADIADGVENPVTTRIKTVAEELRPHIRERQEKFIAEKPEARAYQAGFEANPLAVKKAVEEATKGYEALKKSTESARKRANEALARLELARLARERAAAEAREGVRAAKQVGKPIRETKVKPTLEEAAKNVDVRELRYRSGIAALKYARAHAAQEVARVSATPPPWLERLSPEDRAAFERHVEGLRTGAVKRQKAVERAMRRVEAVAEKYGPELVKQVRQHVKDLLKEQEKAHRAAVNETVRLQRKLSRADKLYQQLEIRAKVLHNIAVMKEERLAAHEWKIIKAREDALWDLTNAPARLRPILAENRHATAYLISLLKESEAKGLPTEGLKRAINELPVALEELQKAGVDAEHLFHVTPKARPGRAAGSKSMTLPKPFKPSSEYIREASPIYERRLVGQFKGEREAVVAAIRRMTVERIKELPGVVEYIGKGQLENVKTIQDAMARGYVPWIPEALFDTTGKLRRTPAELYEAFLKEGGEPPPWLKKAIEEHEKIPLMPRALFDAFRNYFEPPKGQMLGTITDLPNHIYILGRLALSPGYLTGQVFGNMFMGAVGSSSPAQFGRNLLKVIDEYRKTGSLPPEAPARLIKSGSATAEMARLTQAAEARGGRLGTALRATTKLMHKPFAIASFLDNTARAAFYLTELQKRGSAEKALEATLRAMGEFDRMTPIERDYVRRLIPLWAWHREITRIAAHLAVDHPLRVTWILHLGNAIRPEGYFTESDYHEQMVPIGGGLVEVGQAVPHVQVGEIFKGPYLGAGKISGPVPKLLFQSATGERAATGRPFRLPNTAYGEKPKAPSIARQVMDMFPQFRLFEGLTGKRRKALYATGEPIVLKSRDRRGREYTQTIPTGETPLTAISSFLGFPVYNRAEVEAGLRLKAQRRAGAGGDLRLRRARERARARTRRR